MTESNLNSPQNQQVKKQIVFSSDVVKITDTYILYPISRKVIFKRENEISAREELAQKYPKDTFTMCVMEHPEFTTLYQKLQFRAKTRDKIHKVNQIPFLKKEVVCIQKRVDLSRRDVTSKYSYLERERSL